MKNDETCRVKSMGCPFCYIESRRWRISRWWQGLESQAIWSKTIAREPRGLADEGCGADSICPDLPWMVRSNVGLDCCQDLGTWTNRIIRNSEWCLNELLFLKASFLLKLCRRVAPWRIWRAWALACFRVAMRLATPICLSAPPALQGWQQFRRSLDWEHPRRRRHGAGDISWLKEKGYRWIRDATSINGLV